MLPTFAEIQSARTELAAYFAAPLPEPAAKVSAAPRQFALPPTKTQPAPAMLYAGGTAIIDQRRTIAEYAVTEFRADGGRGFRFAKLDGGSDPTASAYDVFLADPAVEDAGYAYSSCDCKGFVRHGHCKHLAAAQAIADRTLPTCSKPASRFTPHTSPDPGADQDRW